MSEHKERTTGLYRWTHGELRTGRRVADDFLMRYLSEIEDDREPPPEHPYWDCQEHPGVKGDCPVCAASEEEWLRNCSPVCIAGSHEFCSGCGCDCHGYAPTQPPRSTDSGTSPEGQSATPHGNAEPGRLPSPNQTPTNA